MMLGPTTFRFLNAQRSLTWPGGWNDPEIDQLWTYNLHYFEDLTARDAAQRAAWHCDLIAAWIRDNPPFAGKGWDPYPLSLRIANWIKWDLDGGQLSPPARDVLALSLRYLNQRIEYHLLGNHLLANAKAFVLGGAYFSGPEADAWLQTGLRLFKEQLPEQILEDGAHFELSPMYHSLILEDLLDLLNLAERYPGLISDESIAAWRAAVQKMRRWLKAMCLPDGDIALFNDAALGIAASPREIDEYATRLGLPPVDEPVDGITHLAASGYVRLQNAEAVVIVDVGEIGPSYLPGHGHADVLTFEMAVNGARLIVNSGTSVYYGDDDQRMRERSTAAHNTVTVDYADSSELWGNFRVARRAHPRDLELIDRGEGGLFVTCAHDGYTRLEGRVVHRRMWHLASQMLRVRDELTGNCESATARFHLHPAVEHDESNRAGARRLRVADREIIVSTDSPASRWSPSTYHPQFGTSVDNWCWTVDVAPAGARSSIRWTIAPQDQA